MNAEGARPIVIKIGGSTLGAHDTSLRDCAALHREGRRVVLVHGGGATVSDWLARMQIASEFIDGLRKTTEETREVVVAVLAGLVNKQLVQQFAALGVSAVGLCGADAGLIRSPINERGLGYVGDAPRCDPTVLTVLLKAGLLPVVAPIGLSPDGEALLNINADSAAGAIAAALEAEEILFLTDVPGILDAEGGVVGELNGDRIAALRADGTIGGGMLPKVEACQSAAARGTRARIIDGRARGAVMAALDGSIGTLVH